MDAVLWDMDGLMVDSEPLWTRAEQELAVSLGGTWDAEVKALRRRHPARRRRPDDPHVLRRRADAGARRRDRRLAAAPHGRAVHRRRAGAAAGRRPLLAALADEQVPTALVSSSYRVLVDAVLAGGVGPFAVTLAGDEVERGKPAPDPYLLRRAAPGRRRRRAASCSRTPRPAWRAARRRAARSSRCRAWRGCASTPAAPARRARRSRA